MIERTTLSLDLQMIFMLANIATLCSVNKFMLITEDETELDRTEKLCNAHVQIILYNATLC